MRAWLLVCAALALAPCRATAARAPHSARLERIKSHILAKLGLTTRPMPLGAPPRDVVQEILHRAQDNQPPADAPAHDERAMREIIAIAQTGFIAKVSGDLWKGWEATRYKCQRRVAADIRKELSNGGAAIKIMASSNFLNY